MKDLKKLVDKNDFDFEGEVRKLVNYIKKRWNWKSFLPIGYKKYKETYNDYQDMEGLEDSMDFDKMKFFDDATAGSHSFPMKISMPHTAYDDTNQGRDPLMVMAGALVGHGISIGARFGEIEAKKAFEEILKDVNIEIRFMDEESKEASLNRIKRTLDCKIEYFKAT